MWSPSSAIPAGVSERVRVFGTLPHPGATQNMIGSQRGQRQRRLVAFEEQKPGQEMVEGEAKSCERGRTGPQETCETGDVSQTSPTEAPRGAPCPCVVATPTRRTLLAAGVGLGVDLAARVAGAQSDAAHARPKAGDLLVKVGDTTPLGPDSLSVGEGQIMTWPMDPAEKVVRDGSRLNKVLLVKAGPRKPRPADQGPGGGWGRSLLGNLSPHRLRGGQLVR